MNDSLAGLDRRRRPPPARGATARARYRDARTRRAAAGRRGRGPRSHPPDAVGRAGADAGRSHSARANSRDAGSAASRWREFSGTRNSGDCRCSCRPRRWCRGPIPKPWWRLALEIAARLAPTGRRCASPTSAPAPARSCWRCCPNCRTRSGVGTDISLEALRTARDNAGRLGLGDRARFVACDYAAALSGPFDLIVSNPPYIRSAEIAGAGGRGPRPRSAPRARRRRRRARRLSRAIAPQARRCWRPAGALVVEVGQGQSADVAALMAAAGLTLSDPPRADLAGIFRAVIGRKPARLRVGMACKKPLGIFARERLRSGHDIGPGLLAPRMPRVRPEFSKREPAGSKGSKRRVELSAMAERLRCLRPAKRTKA